MNSPYLDKPRRSLRQALSDTGRKPSDAGQDESADVAGTFEESGGDQEGVVPASGPDDADEPQGPAAAEFGAPGRHRPGQ